MNRRRLRDVASIAVALIVFAFVLGQVRRRSLDAVIDAGRDLYIAEQIQDGAKLYRDITYIFPPLTPYFLAAVTAVIGNSLAAYEAIGAAIALATMAALYAAVRAVAAPEAAGAAAAMFAACSVYSISGRASNYIIPYSYSATLGMLFFVAGAALLTIHIYRGRTTWSLVLAAVALFAASWTKVEYAAFASALILVAAVVHRLPIKWIAAYVAVGLTSLAAVAALFSDGGMSANHSFIGSISATLPRAAVKAFYRRVMAFEDPVPHVIAAVVAFAVLALIAASIAFASRSRAVAWFAAAALGALLAWWIGPDFFRAWVIGQVILIPFALRDAKDPLLLFLVVSLCSSSRIGLRMTPEWYGFVFLVPLYALAAYVLFEWLPARGWYSPQAARLWLVPIAIACGMFIAAETAIAQRKQFAVRTERGTFFDSNPDRAADLNDFLTYARAHEIGSLVVVPEGVAINYLAHVPTPLTFHTFTPFETADASVEQQIVGEMRQRPPRSVLVVSRDMSDFGYRGFGIDYDRNFAAQIRSNYEVVQMWRRPMFQMVLLRKRS